MLKKNLIFNYIGQAWTALMGLVFIPVYIKYLGIESYGLIGLFGVLQTWLSLLDMGMTPTLNREMARFTGGAHTATSIRDLLRSIEYIAYCAAILAGLGVWAASGWLAKEWLNVGTLPIKTVTQALAIMGVVIALRFVEGVYRSCIVGLQYQVLYNVINSILATLRGVGAVGVLMWVAPTINAFFIWQGAVSLLTLGTLLLVTYHKLPKSGRTGRFSPSSLRDISRYAGGMIGISFLTLLLTQVDKLLLSKFLTLSEYGFYTLAAVVAGGLYMFTAPILQAWFPRLSELHANNREVELIEKYHQGAQLVTVLMGSAAVILIMFSEVILNLWTHDPELASHAAPLLALLAVGNLLNGLMWIPYQTQLAYGWTSLAMRFNVIAVAVIVPAILWITPRYGAVGAAWVWVFINAAYILIGIHLMHRKILINEKWRWYWQDTVQPLASALVVAAFLNWSMPDQLGALLKLIWLLLSSTLTLIAAGVAASRVRNLIEIDFKKLFLTKPL